MIDFKQKYVTYLNKRYWEPKLLNSKIKRLCAFLLGYFDYFNVAEVLLKYFLGATKILG